MGCLGGKYILLLIVTKKFELEQLNCSQKRPEEGQEHDRALDSIPECMCLHQFRKVALRLRELSLQSTTPVHRSQVYHTGWGPKEGRGQR